MVTTSLRNDVGLSLVSVGISRSAVVLLRRCGESLKPIVPCGSFGQRVGIGPRVGVIAPWTFSMISGVPDRELVGIVLAGFHLCEELMNSVTLVILCTL